MVKRLSFLLVFTMFSCFSRGQVQNSAFHAMLQKLLAHNVPEITIRQSPMDSENVLYLDARDKVEFDVSHIENAIRVGYDDFDMTRVKGLNKDHKIIVYCSVGYRSEKISQKLIKAGFKDSAYLKSGKPQAISLTMPLTGEPIKSPVMFPFFDGLIPEGWLLEVAEKNWKLNPRDRMGLLLACCKDCIGAVSVIEDNKE